MSYILPDCPAQRRSLKLTAVPSLNLPKSSHEARDVKRRSYVQHDMENIETKAPVEDVSNKFNVEEIDPSYMESCSSGPSKYSATNTRKTIEMPTVKKEQTLSREGSSEHMEVCEISDNLTSIEKDAMEALLKPNLSLEKGIQVKSGDLVVSIIDRITSRSQLVTMTGIPSFDLLNTIVNLCTEMFHKSKKYKLSMKECTVFTFMKLKTGITYAVLSVLFNIPKASCKTVFHHTL